jgi:Holliday junction resolvase-like predicted endonuclease
MAKKKRNRTRYVRGREAEYKCKAALEKEGYRVTRASSSKGDFDIIAYGPDDTRYIQLKREQKKAGTYPADRDKIRQVKIRQYVTGYVDGTEIQVPIPMTKELWIWSDNLGWAKWIVKDNANEDELIDLRRNRAPKRRGSNRTSSKG